MPLSMAPCVANGSMSLLLARDLGLRSNYLNPAFLCKIGEKGRRKWRWQTPKTRRKIRI